MKKDAELIIIGAGPAGMTAAIYASRAGLNTILLESGAPGGKLLKTNEIANWPGTKRDSGSDLALRMFEHSTIFGAHYQYGEVVSIRRDGQTFSVTLTDGSELTADAVIAAAGTKERLLNIPGEEKNIGRGVSYCAVCDGAFIRGDTAAVIGAGNSALQGLSHHAQRCVSRRSDFRRKSSKESENRDHSKRRSHGNQRRRKESHRPDHPSHTDRPPAVSRCERRLPLYRRRSHQRFSERFRRSKRFRLSHNRRPDADFCSRTLRRRRRER